MTAIAIKSADKHHVIRLTPKQQRLRNEQKALLRRGRDIIQSRQYPLKEVGVRVPIAEWALEAGFSTFDLAFMRVKVAQRLVDVVIVSTRVWRDEPARARLRSLTRRAASAGMRCMLVPQGWLKATCRSNSARALSSSKAVRFAAEDHFSVLVHLIQSKGAASVQSCIAAIDGHEDPAGAVLAMVARGVFRMATPGPISPDSLIAIYRRKPRAIIALAA